MNNVKTLFFATLRDRVGVKSIEIQILTQTKVSDFKTILLERFLSLAGLVNHTLISINHEYASNETLIPNNAETALFPPVSGG